MRRADYEVRLAHPGASFRNTDSAAFEIARMIGGNLFASFFLAGLIVAQFAAGLAIQATSSRLLYAMGRDGVLPRPIFGYVRRGAQGTNMDIRKSSNAAVGNL